MKRGILKIALGFFIGTVVVIVLVYSARDTQRGVEIVPAASAPQATDLTEGDDFLESESLVGVPWVWVRAEVEGGENTIAPDGEKFILTFHNDGTVTSTTDCNSLFSSYVTDGEKLSFGVFGQTQMYCEGSVESVYAEYLSRADSYLFNGRELHLKLSHGFGKMIYVKKN